MSRNNRRMVSWSDLREFKTAVGNSVCLHLSGKYIGQANPTFRNNYRVTRSNGTPRERQPKVVETMAEREARLIKEKADQLYREALATAEQDRLRLERSNELFQAMLSNEPIPYPQPTKIARKIAKFVPTQVGTYAGVDRYNQPIWK